ncbi:MAG: chromosome segregation protein SMC [Clostridia bacterium]|nr:chromosome segregation protein SMC [Clostridia bacterium]
MFLKAIEMQGFKSFPEKTVLNFTSGITAVVGPNGSGKSNISDAVRWVLGEQSSKSLRGSKMEDVIFDGTKVRKAHGFAQVTLRLDNTDRTITDPDADEIVVTRRFFRSGESEYKINGDSVRLRDLHALFMDTGLGRDGYSLVSQGKIADMISGKGRECRDMLEEACGISSYRYRRNDALKRLAQAEENLLRLRDILTELQDRLGPLKTQSEKAEKFLVFAAQRKEVEIGLWLYNIQRLREQLRKLEDDLGVAEHQYAVTEQQLQETVAQMEEAIQASQQITIQIDDIRQQISEREEQAANFDAQTAVLENSIQHNKETIERFLKDKNDTNQSREQISKEIETETQLIAKIDEIAQEKQKKLTAAQQSLSQLGKDDGSLEATSAQINASLSEAAKKAADARVAEWSAHSSMSEIAARLQALSEAIEQRNGDFSALEAEKEKAKKALFDCEESLSALQNVVNGQSMKLKSRTEKADALKKELDDTRFELERNQSKVRMLEDLEKNMEGYSGAVKAVMNEAKRGKLYGIHATVAKLISMDSAYALAVETALGNAVQHIVCDDEGNAKQAIRYLKRERLGRATFQPISAVKGKVLDESGLEDQFGFVGIASNLVQCDEKYREILVSLLGRTLVAEDLDCAVVIAKAYRYRYKIVTLDGQIVNPGGSLTGGSQGKNAGLLTRTAEIERLHQKQETLQKKTDELQVQYDDADAKLSALSAEFEEAKEALSKKNEDQIRLSGALHLANEQFEAAKQALTDMQNEKDAAARRNALLEGELKKAQDETQALNALSVSLNEQLAQLGEQRDALQADRTKLSGEISKLTLELHDAEKDRAVRTDAMNLLKARLISHEDKDKALDEEIAAMEGKNETLRASIVDLGTQIAGLRKQNEQAKELIASLQQQRADTEKNNTLLRAKERELSAQRERISGEKARLEMRKETLGKDYEDTLTRLFDEYQLTLHEAQEQFSVTEEPTVARRTLAELKGKIRALGAINVSAIDEYKEVSERHTFLSGQLDDVERSKAELNRLISELTDKMSSRFREQFSKINRFFDETFRELFDGGKAELLLEDPADVLESNIEIRLQPPGKNVKRMDALSGGEKGLSAISLLFAILKVNPAPFCIFDEVEAALDDVNVTRYAQYVRRMTKNTQFILITHRRGTMEEADRLYGITMQEQGVSKLLELKTAEIASRLGITG